MRCLRATSCLLPVVLIHHLLHAVALPDREIYMLLARLHRKLNSMKENERRLGIEN
jgi:hypothetical protein